MRKNRRRKNDRQTRGMYRAMDVPEYRKALKFIRKQLQRTAE